MIRMFSENVSIDHQIPGESIVVTVYSESTDKGPLCKWIATDASEDGANFYIESESTVQYPANCLRDGIAAITETFA